MSDPDPDDPFRRLNYRRLIAWPERIEREWPFLESLLREAPERSVIDLGCGTGEHCTFLAAKGAFAAGIDRSAPQIEKAREYEGAHGECGPRFYLGEIARLPDLCARRFGMAICLGNVLPYFEDEALRDALTAVASRLLPGGRLVVQVLNYRRILDQDVRHLPLNFRPDPEEEGGEIVWVRIMSKAQEGHVRFFPTTLRVRAGREPPVEIHAAREVVLRAWLWPELERLLGETGFGAFQLFGDMRRAPFDPQRSQDLIFTAAARRAAVNGRSPS
ncbi:MAG: class I SAM-dependent methyltransferase [Planctomycetes bacterium]|nr:class I SAM-dependent methyltransferase [Planctomycetota bacterium]